MKLIKKLFGKKKYDMGDEELVWTREGTDPNHPNPVEVTQEQISHDDMVMPKSYNTKINSPGIGRKKYNVREASPRNQYNQATYANNEPTPYYPTQSEFDDRQYPQSNFNVQQFNYEFNNQMQYNTKREPERYGDPYSHYNAPDNNVKPELREYYEIEQKIQERMRIEQIQEKQKKEVNQSNAFVKKPPMRPKPIRKNKIGLNEQGNKTKRDYKNLRLRKTPIFKKIDVADTHETEEQTNTNVHSISKKVSQDYMQMSLTDLQQMLQVKNAKIQQLEEQHQNLLQSENNVTTLTKQIDELKRDTGKLKEKTEALETEHRLLLEELMNKKENLNEIEVTLAKIPKFSETESEEKKKLIAEIEAQQKRLDMLTDKLNRYKNGDKKELEAIEKNSEKNMQMELEEIKINVMNYDEELLKWLKYFERKPLTEFSQVDVDFF